MVIMKYEKILVPVDGSEFGKMALQRALNAAEYIGSEIIVLTVAEVNVSYGFRYAGAAKELAASLIKEAEAIIEETKEFTKDKEVNIQFIVEKGSPASIILDTVDELGIDLLIIGSSGKSGVNKFLMGSVAEKVVSYAKCDVLVIHKEK